MDRQQAAEALQLLKKVVAQARDDTALENWGLVWIMTGLTTGGGFIATHFMLDAGFLRLSIFRGSRYGLILARQLVYIPAMRIAAVHSVLNEVDALVDFLVYD